MPAGNFTRLPMCILVEALDTFPWSMPTGSFTRPGCRSVRTRTRATAAGRISTRSHAAGFADVHPGRGPRQAHMVDAGGELHAAGLPIGADQDPGDTAAGRISTRSHVAGCRRASRSRPSTGSPGRCRRGASRGRVADRCRPGPGRRSAAVRTSTRATRPRAGPRQAHHAAGFADVHPGRGPRQAHPVDAGGKLHAAGLPIGADQDRGDDRPRAGSQHAPTWPVSDVHPGRGPRQAHLVDAGGELHAAGADVLSGRGPRHVPLVDRHAAGADRPRCRSVWTIFLEK